MHIAFDSNFVHQSGTVFGHTEMMKHPLAHPFIAVKQWVYRSAAMQLVSHSLLLIPPHSLRPIHVPPIPHRPNFAVLETATAMICEYNYSTPKPKTIVAGVVCWGNYTDYTFRREIRFKLESQAKASECEAFKI